MPFFTQSVNHSGTNGATPTSTSAPKNAAVPKNAGAATDSAQPTQQAALLLSGYHGIPAKAVFDRNLKAPKTVLISFARGEETLPLQRQRALEALEYYADADVEALYSELLQDERAPERMRHRVMALFAKNFPKAALPALEPFLAHSDLQYRLSAIDAIRHIPGDAAHEALQRAAKSETNKVAQKRLARYTRITR